MIVCKRFLTSRITTAGNKWIGTIGNILWRRFITCCYCPLWSKTLYVCHMLLLLLPTGNQCHFSHAEQFAADHTAINDLLGMAQVQQVNYPNDTRVMTLWPSLTFPLPTSGKLWPFSHLILGQFPSVPVRNSSIKCLFFWCSIIK